MSGRHDFAQNRRALATALEEMMLYINLRLSGQPAPLGTYLEVPPALAALGGCLELSRFELDLLLLAAAPELDTRMRPLLAKAQGDPDKPWLSFNLALLLLPHADWSAITPAARLRRWNLLEPVGPGGPLQCRLVVDESTLHRIAGLRYVEPRLEPWFRQQALPTPNSVPFDGEVALLGLEWQAAANLSHAVVARLEQGDGESCAHTLAVQLELKLFRLAEHNLPASAPEREQLARLWEREALLHNALLWLDVEHTSTIENKRLGDFIEHLQGLVLITGSASVPLRRPLRALAWLGGDASTRLQTWQHCLGDQAGELNGHLGPLAEQFQLSSGAIARVSQYCGVGAGLTAEQLWDACRAEARRGMENLAERVEARADWADLVLPDAALTSLRAIAAQVRQRTRVYREWGFAARSGRGLGISALFAGGSGTGKTLAAEVLANELQLDLYRIDLAALVSKYIGETEKNLARVFAVAETSGAILLFDEADALFGKRSEVRDSHDRYANLEVSYLLQRIETYRGLAILTSNLKQAIDSAFQRRLRFIVQFPFPDAQARGAIWARVFPDATPVAGLDIGKLARLSLSGGHIRNLALNAAFLAADQDRPVSMGHLRLAAESEFAKLERPLPMAEIGDWA